MKLNLKFKKLTQIGSLSLHTILPLALVVMAIGGVGAYVLKSSNAATATVAQCYGKTLKLGSTDKVCVAKVQTLINAWDNRSGYDFLATAADRVRTDGVFDATTVAGLKKYQAREKIAITGIAQASPTWAKLCPTTGKDSQGNNLPTTIKDICVASAAPAWKVVNPPLAAATYTCSNLKLLPGTNIGYTAVIKVKNATDISKFSMIDFEAGGAPIGAAETGVIPAGGSKMGSFKIKHVAGAKMSVSTAGVARATCALAPVPPPPPPKTPASTTDTTPPSASEILAAIPACKATFPATITFGRPLSPTPTITVTNNGATAIAAGKYSAAFTSNAEGQTPPPPFVLPAMAANASVQYATAKITAPAIKPGAKVTYNAWVITADGKAKKACASGGDKTYDLGTGKTTATPTNLTAAAQNKAAGEAAKDATNGGSGSGSGGGSSSNNGNNSQYPNGEIEKLGYNVSTKMLCAKGTKQKGTFKRVNCVDATFMIMRINGSEKDKEGRSKPLLKDDITYRVNITDSSKDKFTKVDGCQKVIVSHDDGTVITYPCAVVFKDKKFFEGVSDSIKNRLQKIVRKADGKNSYTSSKEAKLAIEKLNVKDIEVKEFKAKLSAKGYKPAEDKGYLYFNYDESDLVNDVKQQRADDLAAAAAAKAAKQQAPSSGSGSAGLTPLTKPECTTLHRAWVNVACSYKKCDPSKGYTYVHQGANQYDYCKSNSSKKDCPSGTHPISSGGCQPFPRQANKSTSQCPAGQQYVDIRQGARCVTLYCDDDYKLRVIGSKFSYGGNEKTVDPVGANAAGDVIGSYVCVKGKLIGGSGYDRPGWR